MISLKDTLAKVMFIHEQRYATDSSELQPFVLLFKDDEMVGMVGLEMAQDQEAKIAMVHAIRAFIAENGITATVFSSEAWMSVLDPEAYNSDDYVRPSQDPKRVEVLIVEARDENGGLEHAMRKIIRDEATGRVRLKEYDKDLNQGFASSIFEFFPPKRTMH